MRAQKKILKYTAIALLTLAAASLVLVQIPRVQTFVAQKALSSLQGKTDALLEMEALGFKPFNTIVARGIAVIDPSPRSARALDTLLYAGSLSARFSLTGLLTGSGVRLRSVTLQDAQFNLMLREDGTDDNNLKRLLHLEESKKSVNTGKLFHVDRLAAENLRFRMINLEDTLETFPPTAIDWRDVDVTDIRLQAKDIGMNGGYVSGEVVKLSFAEKCGWRVRHLSGKAKVGMGKVEINDFFLDDGESFARIDYSMTGRSEEYQDYVNKVIMDADIRQSKWSLRSLCRFIPPLACDSTVFVTIKGQMHGPVADMHGENLEIAAEDMSLRINANGDVGRLPDVQNMTINASARILGAKMDELSRLVGAIAPRSKADFSALCKGQTLSGTARVSGPINNMRASARLVQKDRGEVSVKAVIKNTIDKYAALGIEGSLQSSALDLGAVLGNPVAGEATLDASFSLKAGRRGQFSAAIHEADLQSVWINGHEFNDAFLQASLQGRDLTASFRCRDDALDADIGIWSESRSYHASASLRHADLQAMGLDKRGTSKVHMDISASLGKDLSVLTGNAVASNILLENGSGAHRIGDITLQSDIQENGRRDISLQSDFARASLSLGSADKEMEADFLAGDSRELFAFVLPGMYIESGTRIKARSDKEGIVGGSLSSGRIAFGKNYIKNLSGSLGGDLDNVLATIKYDVLQAGERVQMKDNLITAQLRGTTLSLQYKGGSGKGKESNAADLDLSVGWNADTGTAICVNPSTLCLLGRQWNISPSSLRINGRNVDVDSLTIEGGRQRIFARGSTSLQRADSLRVLAENVDISIINEFTSKPYAFAGRVSVDGAIYSPLSEGIPALSAAVECDSLGMGGATIGRLEGRIEKGQGEDKDLMARLSCTSVGGKKILLGGMNRDSGSADNNVHLHLDEFPLGIFQPLVPMVFDKMSGTVSGNFAVKIPHEGEPAISSEGGRIDNATLGIAYTRVPYTVSGTFAVDNNGIMLKEASVKDRFGNPARASGGLRWKAFKDMKLDLAVGLDGAEALNIPAKGADLYYGQLFASGDATIRGPFGDIEMEASARTTGSGNLHISLGGSSTASGGELLTFINPYSPHKEDPYEKVLKDIAAPKEESSSFKFKLHATAHEGVKAYLDLDNLSEGTGLSGTGTGAIDMEAGSDTFSLRGDYTLGDGVFGMSAANIIRRDFKIRSGSSIKFGGDIFDSTVDLDAYYSTKASISTLISDTTSVANRRAVQCGISLKDKLKEPTIKLSIDIPDLEPSVKSRVESALSTEDKVQKQFLSLLLSNSFLPDEQSGIVNNSALLYSNVSEIMANQINNIFTKLDIPLDLGLNYQRGESGGKDCFDVAISTQLWNNRVIIGGQFGNRQSSTSAGSNLFGDLDVEIKLNRSGAFRLKLFSHSADQYSNFIDNSQRNGAGFTWQREFDRIRELLRRNSAADEGAQNEKQTLVLDE